MAADCRCAPRSILSSSAWRATALINGFVSYDHRHSGWRGPVKNIDIKGDWGKGLGSMPVWTDIDPWRLAVVLDVAKDKATIGLRPGRTPQGVLVKERETGVIPYRGSEMGKTEGRRRLRRYPGIGQRRSQAWRRDLCLAARAETGR